MSHKKLTIGLFGFGVVGEGLYRVLEQTPSLHARMKRICIKNPEKERIAPASLFTTNRDELLDDPHGVGKSKPALALYAPGLEHGQKGAAVAGAQRMGAGWHVQFRAEGIHENPARFVFYEKEIMRIDAFNSHPFP